MKRLSKAALVASLGLALAATGGSVSGATGATTTGGGADVNATNQQKNAIKNQIKATRLTPSGRYRYRFLKPVTKQKFKQNQRKELSKSRKKRNKQF